MNKAFVIAPIICGIVCIVIGTMAPAYAGTLSCSVTTAAACVSPSVVAWRMSSSSNAHSELATGTTATYANTVVCCGGVSGLGNSCSATFAKVLQLSSSTNAHAGEVGATSYAANPICLQAPAGGSVSAGYASSGTCSAAGYDTTLGSMAAADNSHVGDSNAYTTKICASASASASLTFTTDASSESFPTVNPGTLSATTSILQVTTSNPSGFSITLQRGDPTGTMSLGSTYIPDKTDWVAPLATTSAGNSSASTTQPQTLQFRVRFTGTDTPNYSSAWWGTNDTTASALFGGVPSTTQKIINRSTAAASVTTAYVQYDLNVPVSQKNGTYSGSITYTVTANP